MSKFSYLLQKIRFEVDFGFSEIGANHPKNILDIF